MTRQEMVRALAEGLTYIHEQLEARQYHQHSCECGAVWGHRETDVSLTYEGFILAHTCPVCDVLVITKAGSYEDDGWSDYASVRQ